MYFVQGPKGKGWGVGSTEEEAIRNCAIECDMDSESKKFRYVVFLVDDEKAYVDDEENIIHSEASTITEVRRKE